MHSHYRRSPYPALNMSAARSALRSYKIKFFQWFEELFYDRRSTCNTSFIVPFVQVLRNDLQY